ncbi:MAG: TolC family protein [Phycisphaerae bacterium]|nr:TolC family protein [Saprospiraceae bacterium]
MKTTTLTTLALCFLPFLGWATDTLTVEQCRAIALQNSPLQQKKLYAETVSALQIRNLRSNSLPRIQVGAQATWQSDVFGLPFNFPGSDIPEVPKDQYKLSVDVAQRIWDGGTDRHVRQQRELERELAAAQVDVDAISLREIVTDLYFKALLLQESEAVLVASKKDLQTRLKQTEAAVSEGIALRTSADQIKIQVLKTDQQIAATQSDHQALLEILAKWVGQNVVPATLVAGSSKAGNPAAEASSTVRPEHTLFSLQQRSLQIGKDALGLRAQPRIEAFVQGGIGRPNPFNFFETGFEPFYLVGLRAFWMPIDWGNKRREAQVFDIQIKNLDVQRQFFDQRLETSALKDQQDEAKWRAQLAQDDAIIALQADIIQRADTQVKNGVMTVTDYLTQLNLLTQAQLNRKTHEIQAVQAVEMQRAKMRD